jgi:hypothetical protein
MVPSETLVFADSLQQADRSKLRVKMRGQFETHQLVVSKDYDLAAVVVPAQDEETTQAHFYQFAGRRTIPRIGSVVGFSGYPSARAQRLDANYAVFPFCEIGDICNEQVEYDSKTEMLVRYYWGGEVDQPTSSKKPCDLYEPGS